ncbi:MAG: hypothetical protein K5656_08510 [Lachnospiraceae bacterium]|nr:hypothetical protein [Lachnospiraceae bacterium]
MEHIIVFTEGLSDELNNFVDAHDDDNHHIHLYEDIVTSSGGNLYLALAEVFINVCDYYELNNLDTDLKAVDTKDKLLIVTDLPILSEQLKLLYGEDDSSLIEILEMGKNITGFFPSYKKSDLLNYELSMLMRFPMVYALLKLYQIRQETNLIDWTNVSEQIRSAKKNKLYFGDKVMLHFLNLILLDIEENDYEYAYSFTLSIKMQIKKDAESLIEYLLGLDRFTTLSPVNGYFIWGQLQFFKYCNMVCNNEESLRLQNNLYSNCFNAFAEACGNFTKPILRKHRNPNRVMILATQFLPDGHYPSDMIKGFVLALKKIGYEVFIFNTTERYLAKGYVPLFGAVGGNVVKEYQNLDEIDCAGTKVKYYQPSNVSSYLDVLNKAINKAYEYKPLYILTMGNGSIIGDILDRMIPTAAMDITSTELPTSKSRIRILTRPFEKNEKRPNYYKDGYTVVAPNFNYQIQTVEDAMKVAFNIDRQIIDNLRDESPVN